MAIHLQTQAGAAFFKLRQSPGMLRTFSLCATLLTLAGHARAQTTGVVTPSSTTCQQAVGKVRFGTRANPQVSKRVSALFAADQQDRQGVIDWSKVSVRDRRRRAEVKGFLERGELFSAEDYYGAAFIFQHGECLADYKLANTLAEQAMKKGHPKAAWIYAATLDRWLMNQGKPQKFGTQYLGDANGCGYKLYAVDPKTTDAERAKYGVPTLAEAQARAKTMQSPACKAKSSGH